MRTKKTSEPSTTPLDQTPLDQSPLDQSPLDQSPLERQQLNVSGASAHTFWHWVRFDIVVREALRREATTIVDVGAGSGMLGDWLSQHHPDLSYSFDELSPALDTALENRFGEAARHDDAQRIDAATVVTMLDVIEHIEDDHQALVDLRSRCEPGAGLVVTVPALQWAFSSWDTELGHFRRYSKKQLAATLTEAGFDVRRVDYLFPEMTPLLPIRKLRRAKRDSVDFPTLSPIVNKIGYRFSSLTARCRRVWPMGTSVVAIAEVSKRVD